MNKKILVYGGLSILAVAIISFFMGTSAITGNVIAIAEDPSEIITENPAEIIAELTENAEMMGKFKEVRNKVPDLQKTLTISKDDPRNIYEVSDEIYYYSESLDKTFVLCEEHDALNAVLDGNVELLSEAELENALEPWKINSAHVMEMMMGGEDMGDM